MFSDQAELTFRPVQQADEPLLYDLFCSVRAPQFARANLTAEQQQQLLRHQFLAMHASYAQHYPHGGHYIVEQNGEPIGRVYVNESNEELRLLDIIIARSRRNQGVGARVLQQMIERSNATGKPIRFYVWQDNVDAQRFYERLGFNQVRDDQSYLLYERRP